MDFFVNRHMGPPYVNKVKSIEPDLYIVVAQMELDLTAWFPSMTFLSAVVKLANGSRVAHSLILGHFSCEAGKWFRCKASFSHAGLLWAHRDSIAQRTVGSIRPVGVSFSRGQPFLQAEMQAQVWGGALKEDKTHVMSPEKWRQRLAASNSAPNPCCRQKSCHLVWSQSWPPSPNKGLLPSPSRNGTAFAFQKSVFGGPNKSKGLSKPTPTPQVVSLAVWVRLKPRGSPTRWSPGWPPVGF